MSVLNSLIDATESITTSSAEFAAERLRALTWLGGLAVVAIVLLIWFWLEPISATVVAIVLILAATYAYTNREQ